MELVKKAFLISDDKNKINISYVHQFLAQSYWAANIPVEIVERSVKNSLCFGLYEGKQQIGFARVVTDHATFGYLADVFIDEKFRGLGLAKWLMETIMAQPDLQGFRSWLLATKDAHSLYSQFGFKSLENPERFMRKHNPDVYKI